MPRYSRRMVNATPPLTAVRRAGGSGHAKSMSSWTSVLVHVAYVCVLSVGILWFQLEAVCLVVDVAPKTAQMLPGLWIGGLSVVLNTGLYRPLVYVNDRFQLEWVWLTLHNWTTFTVLCAFVASHFFLPFRKWLNY